MHRPCGGKWMFLAVLAAVTGCGPTVSTSNLGRIVYEVPDVAAASVPYHFPDAAKDTGKKKAHEASDSSAAGAIPSPLK